MEGGGPTWLTEEEEGRGPTWLTEEELLCRRPEWDLSEKVAGTLTGPSETFQRRWQGL